MPPAEPTTLSGNALLQAITDAIVALHVRYYHRTPMAAKTQLMGDDLIACTLSGIFTDVEKTMIELQQDDVVKATRGDFQRATEHRFISEIERLTGRTVSAFMSNHHIGPDMAVELFMLKAAHATPEQPS